MGYISDYLFYSSGNECPEDYLYWGALSLLGHILGHKVWVDHGDYFRFPPNLYIALVGDTGSGKNTALGVNMDIMLEHFQGHLLSASIQSREDIADLMADAGCVHTWQDSKSFLGTKDQIYEYRPFYVLNNELASFLSVDKMKMVEFLTEVFDGKRFSTGFKGQRKLMPERKQWFHNPHLSLIAGAVPTWFMSSLKIDLFSGGLGRRMIIVNSERTKVIPIPLKPKGADEAMARVVRHLKEAEKFYGRVTLSPLAVKWWREWYTAQRKLVVTDPILSQFHETKPMQVLKVALVLTCSELPLQHSISADTLELSSKLLLSLEDPVIRLTSGVGRNELAGVGAQLLDHLRRVGGACSKTELRKFFWRYLDSPEFERVLQNFIDTQQLEIYRIPWEGTEREVYFLPNRFKEWVRSKASKSDKTAPEAGGQTP